MFIKPWKEMEVGEGLDLENKVGKGGLIAMRGSHAAYIATWLVWTMALSWFSSSSLVGMSLPKNVVTKHWQPEM